MVTFTDPIHGKIRIPDAFNAVLQSAALTRLRNIRQLGFTLATYPGAVHTRYEHTLGTVAVLNQLFTQFGVHGKDIIDRFTLYALISEVGIYPLSYSTRAIFTRYGYDKRSYATKVYTLDLARKLSWMAVDPKELWEPNQRKADWFAPVQSIPAFAYMDPIKLASTVDYVLRDSYYTGRYAGAFDYRYFASMRVDANVDELRESLRALHRAVNALNATYGDPLRRALTALLTILVDRLVEAGHLAVDSWKDESAFLSLDDDEFLSQIGDAVARAQSAGDSFVADLFLIVTQRAAPIIVPPDTGAATAEDIAAEHGLPAERVFLSTSESEGRIGFRMFGIDYANLDAAIASEMFQACTGLTTDTHAVDSLRGVIVPRIT